jgi:hypothetical protein
MSKKNFKINSQTIFFQRILLTLSLTDMIVHVRHFCLNFDTYHLIDKSKEF